VGKLPLSVPANGRGTIESSGRSHSCGLPLLVTVNTKYRPSGDGAKPPY
jgi:hypothetical protein